MESADLMKSILSIIPPLSFSSHKGQAGRIGIIGGCKEYTGAPFFAAISALKVGCDLVHVFCTQDAGPVIKSYSPELIVHPILDSSSLMEEFCKFLPRIHSLVIGPGLGRENRIFDGVKSIIAKAKEAELPMVLDADALFYINSTPELISGYRKAILTPNEIEFSRLLNAVSPKDRHFEPGQQAVKCLSRLLGNVTIVQKGFQDVISDGESTVVCKEPGSPRRCGGQGDLLSGSMGTFTYWAHSYCSNSAREKLPYNATIVAAVGACMLTRKCNWLAFQKYARSTLTSDMIAEIRTAFSILFPVD